jgi:hypothetical protein
MSTNLHYQADAVNGSAPDPGDLLEQIDVDLRHLVTTRRLGLDGTPHITPDELERAEADLLPVAYWRGDGR